MDPCIYQSSFSTFRNGRPKLHHFSRLAHQAPSTQSSVDVETRNLRTCPMRRSCKYICIFVNLTGVRLFRSSSKRHRLQATEGSVTLTFCLLAQGTPGSTQMLRSDQATAQQTFQKRRDAVANAVIAALWQAPGTAYDDRAAVILFEDNTCWTLNKALAAEFHFPGEHQLLKYIWRAAHGDNMQSGVMPLTQGSLEDTIFHLLLGFGDADGCVLVLLDEGHPLLPLRPQTLDSHTSLRHAFCVLGCPAGFGREQEVAFESAAKRARWPVLRASLGSVPEFTTKIIARLQVWHSCGNLFTSLACLLDIGRPALPWPSQSDAWPFNGDSENKGSGRFIHFVIPISAPLSAVLDGCEEPYASSIFFVIQCCIAALWHPRGAYQRCRVSFVFEKGHVLWPSRHLVYKMIRAGYAPTEFRILEQLQHAVRRAFQEPSGTWPAQGHPSRKRPVCVQSKLRLFYQSSTTHTIHLDSPTVAADLMKSCADNIWQGSPSCACDAIERSEVAPPFSGNVDRVAGQHDLVIYFGNSDMLHHRTSATLRGVHPGNAVQTMSILQSVLLGKTNGDHLLKDILGPAWQGA